MKQKSLTSARLLFIYETTIVNVKPGTSWSNSWFYGLMIPRLWRKYATMPEIKRKKVKSLFQICADFVVDNMGFWCKKSNKLMQPTDPEISSNPFDGLCKTLTNFNITLPRWTDNHLFYNYYTATVAIDYVFKRLSGNGPLNCPIMKKKTVNTIKEHRRHLEMLMTPQLSTLKMNRILEDVETREISPCINAASFRCPVIRYSLVII